MDSVADEPAYHRDQGIKHDASFIRISFAHRIIAADEFRLRDITENVGNEHMEFLSYGGINHRHANSHVSQLFQAARAITSYRHYLHQGLPPNSCCTHEIFRLSTRAETDEQVARFAKR